MTTMKARYFSLLSILPALLCLADRLTSAPIPSGENQPQQRDLPRTIAGHYRDDPVPPGISPRVNPSDYRPNTYHSEKGFTSHQPHSRSPIAEAESSEAMLDDQQQEDEEFDRHKQQESPAQSPSSAENSDDGLDYDNQIDFNEGAASVSRSFISHEHIGQGKRARKAATYQRKRERYRQLRKEADAERRAAEEQRRPLETQFADLDMGDYFRDAPSR